MNAVAFLAHPKVRRPALPRAWEAPPEPPVTLETRRTASFESGPPPFDRRRRRRRSTALPARAPCQVRASGAASKRDFLQRKGLTEAEIDEAFRRVPQEDAPPAAAAPPASSVAAATLQHLQPGAPYATAAPQLQQPQPPEQRRVRWTQVRSCAAGAHEPPPACLPPAAACPPAFQPLLPPLFLPRRPRSAPASWGPPPTQPSRCCGRTWRER